MMTNIPYFPFLFIPPMFLIVWTILLVIQEYRESKQRKKEKILRDAEMIHRHAAKWGTYD